MLERWRRAAQYGDPTDIVEERALCFHKAGPRGAEIHQAIFKNTDINEELPRLKAATRDPLEFVQKDVQKRIPRSKLVTIDNGLVYVDRMMPREFVEPILSFLQNPGI